MGIWQSVSIAMLYLPFLQLGIHNGLNIDLPLLLGKKEKENAFKHIATAKYYFTLICILVITLTLLITVIMLCHNIEIKTVSAVFVIGLMVSLLFYRNYLTALYRTGQDFGKITKINIIIIIITLISILFVKYFGYWGLLIFNIVPQIIAVNLLNKFKPFNNKAEFTFCKFKNLFNIGFKMMSLIQIHSFSLSIPRLILLNFGGILAVGIYAPAFVIQNILFKLPSSITSYFLPEITYKYGVNPDTKIIWKYVIKIYIAFTIIFLPVSIAGYFLLPSIVQYLFPQYIESLNAMQIMMFSILFSAGSITHNFLYIIKKFIYSYFYYIIELLLTFLIPLTFIYFGNQLYTDLAYGILLTSFLLFLTNLFIFWLALIKHPGFEK